MFCTQPLYCLIDVGKYPNRRRNYKFYAIGKIRNFESKNGKKYKNFSNASFGVFKEAYNMTYKSYSTPNNV